jgi:cytochrome P450
MAAQIPREIANAIVDPKAYADGRRSDEALLWLRRHAPLARAEPDHYRPFWVVTRHGDIAEVERRSDTFRAGDTFTTLTSIADGERIMTVTGGSPRLLRQLLHMDGRDHFAHRRLTQGWFMPQKLHGLEARIRVLARHHVDRMAGSGGHCDFVQDVALHYPLALILELLGVPAEDAPLLQRLSGEVLGSSDPELSRSRAPDGAEGTAIAGHQAAVAELMSYFAQLTAARQKTPGGDLASRLALATIDGDPLGELELLSYYISFLCGAYATSCAIAGGLWALLDHPDQMTELLDGNVPLDSMIDETLRWVTPVKHIMRTAAEDTELADTKIAEDDWVLLSYPSGNRDDSVFDSPFSFKLARTPNPHQAFGAGPHLCLGRHLGHLQIRLFWEELLKRLAAIEWDGVPRNMEANFICGPKSVPVRFKLQ